MLDYQSVNINWSYDRTGYYTVTDTYRVTVEPTSGSAIAVDRPSTDRDYNMTGLQAETRYGVSVMAVTSYGNRISQVMFVTTPRKRI